MTTRRDLVLGARTVVTLACALPISLLASVGVALLPFFSRDAGVSAGYFSWPVLFVAVATALFVSERPSRVALGWVAFSSVACASAVFL
jgi:hypothetical protein